MPECPETSPFFPRFKQGFFPHLRVESSKRKGTPTWVPLRGTRRKNILTNHLAEDCDRYECEAWCGEYAYGANATMQQEPENADCTECLRLAAEWGLRARTRFEQLSAT